MNLTPQPTLAASITRAASQQTYYTIRFLVDRERVADAYRAYAYFRWVDDTLDAGSASSGERFAFIERQKSLLERCYRGEYPQNATVEEKLLIELVQHDHEKDSGLQFYFRNMMQVMDFDARRRGCLVSQAELNAYTYWLAGAVTEAMHYFIGHDCYAPRPHDETRYLAVTGAHITHMLRDTFDDVQAGYYNIPREVLEAAHMRPQDVQAQAYCDWVRSRVQLARECFRAGREYLATAAEPRCRLAGFAYIARFEWVLDTMEREGYCLRPEYNERKSFGAGLRMGLLTLLSTLNWRGTFPQPVVSRPLRKL
ncbi:MAG TPA: squalene/phytoene synthase family protein [Anaerolineales bacterium]|nr:squalene/phytoene synthase family protein [Anaerolineales bacterium]